MLIRRDALFPIEHVPILIFALGIIDGKLCKSKWYAFAAIEVSNCQSGVRYLIPIP